MFNPLLIQALVNQKLDEILSGNLPDGFKLKSKTENRVELIALGGEVFGIKFVFLRLVFVYKGVEIILSHE